MNFERGLDVKETLGLGKFSGINKKFRETMTTIMKGEIQSWTWTTSTKNKQIYQVEPAKEIHRNKPDSGGGNNHKFYTYLSLNDFKNYSSVKDQIKAQHTTLARRAMEEGFKIISLNFYIGSKPIRKAGFEKGKNELLIEIVYAELRKK